MRTSLAVLATASIALTALTAPPALAKPTPAPVVDVRDTTATESAITPDATLEIRLDRKPTKPVTVRWKTADGTAKAGSDYTAASGRLVFKPGERVKRIKVETLDDSTSEQTEFFSVTYTAKGAKPKRKRASVSLVDDDLSTYAGQLQVTERWEQEANGFYTLETWTLVFRPQLAPTNEGTAWYDDGLGAWQLTGSRVYEDRRPGAKCPKLEEEIYSGEGTFFTGPHPDTDAVGTVGNLNLQAFFPQHADNLGRTPTLHTVVSGRAGGVTYSYDGRSCVGRSYNNEERFALMEAPGEVSAGKVVFDHHVLQDNSGGVGLDTYQLDVTGELSALPAPA